MYEVRRWAIERVAGIYGVPLGMVGLDSNLKEAQSQFYADTLPPYCEEFTKMLNLRVLVRVYNWTDGCFEFNLDEKHMGDDRLRSLVSATGRAVMLTDEARAKLNLPPVPGGDELVTPIERDRVKRIVDTEGSIYAFKLAGHFDMGQVANYLKAMADGAAQGFNDKIHEEVDANGVDWAMGRRAQHVESAGAGLGAAATRWAREEAARQSPGAEHRVKVWIPDTDRHAEFGGDTVALGDDWPAGFAPGSAPGCRCSMAIE
jgi:hypothetical protein